MVEKKNNVQGKIPSSSSLGYKKELEVEDADEHDVKFADDEEDDFFVPLPVPMKKRSLSNDDHA